MEERKIGRPLDPIWDHYNRISKDNSQYISGVCLYCGNEILNGLTVRLRNHLLTKCRSVPAQVINEIKKHTKGASVKINNPIKRENLLGKNIGKATSVNQNELEALFSLMIYSTGVSFRFVENPFVKKFFATALPNFKLPNRKKLGGQLLSEIYNNCRDNVVEKLKEEEYLSLVSDGWSDQNKHHMVNFLLTSPNFSPIFWKSINTSSKSNSGKYIHKYLNDVIVEVNEITNNKMEVCAIVVDNAANMRKGCELLTLNMPKIFHIGCAAHALNLIMKAALSHTYLQDIITKATTISNFVRKSYIVLDQFRYEQNRFKQSHKLRALCVPMPTRWYTSLRCMRRVYENKVVFGLLVDSLVNSEEYDTNNNKFQEFRSKIASESFWTRTEIAIQLLQPIDDALGVCEKDSASISTIYEVLRNLYTNKVYCTSLMETSHFEFEICKTVQQHVKSEIQKKMSSHITAPVRAAAFLDPGMDPQIFKLEGLNEYELAMRDILDLASINISQSEENSYKSEVLQELDSWNVSRNKKKLWCETFYRSSSPYLRWETGFHDFPKLKDLAKRLFSTVPSSAASERSWSIHDFIHTKKRNNLDVAKVEKLVFIYSNIRYFLPNCDSIFDNIGQDMNPDTFVSDNTSETSSDGIIHVESEDDIEDDSTAHSVHIEQSQNAPRRSPRLLEKNNTRVECPQSAQHRNAKRHNPNNPSTSSGSRRKIFFSPLAKSKTPCPNTQ